MLEPSITKNEKAPLRGALTPVNTLRCRCHICFHLGNYHHLALDAGAKKRYAVQHTGETPACASTSATIIKRQRADHGQ